MNEVDVAVSIIAPYKYNFITQGKLEDLYAYIEQMTKTDALVFKEPIIYIFQIKQEGYYEAMIEMMEMREEDAA
jgi:hypothetical protein